MLAVRNAATEDDQQTLEHTPDVKIRTDSAVYK